MITHTNGSGVLLEIASGTPAQLDRNFKVRRDDIVVPSEKNANGSVPYMIGDWYIAMIGDTTTTC